MGLWDLLRKMSWEFWTKQLDEEELVEGGESETSPKSLAGFETVLTQVMPEFYILVTFTKVACVSFSA